jgi:two-component system phosphate regulon response regulator PhoB
MTRQTILVVDDEKDILELVRYNLAKNGYEVLCAKTGEEGLELTRAKLPDLVVLDLMLPGVDGLDVCRMLKAGEATRAIPVVMLTARGEEADVVSGLELGAEDYVVKPFSPRVLTARIRAVLRRRREPQVADDSAVLKIHNMVIDPKRHEVLVRGKAVELTFTEFKILQFLARRPGWVFTRYQIVDAARGHDAAVTERAVDVHIVSLRRKLGSVGQCIETVRGVGYKMKDAQ